MLKAKKYLTFFIKYNNIKLTARECIEIITYSNVFDFIVPQHIDVLYLIEP